MLGIEGSTFTVDGIDRGTYGGKSLVLDGGYATRTLSAGDRQEWIFGTSMKWSADSGQRYLLSVANGGTDTTSMFIGDNSGDGSLAILGQSTIFLQTNAKYRDPNKHIDIIISCYTPDATANNRFRLWVDGEEVTSFVTRNNPSISASLAINQATRHALFTNENSPGASLAKGYASKTFLISGKSIQQGDYAITDFVYQSADTGKYVPKDISGLAESGTNSFYLDYNDDRSGTPDTTTVLYDQWNSNNWTGNSLVAGSFTSDRSVDNYATLNALSGGIDASLLGNGNLTISAPASASRCFVGNSWAKEGKHVFEGKFTSAPTVNGGIGLYDVDSTYTANNLPDSGTGVDYNPVTGSVDRVDNGSATNIGTYATYGSGDVIRYEWDCDAGTVEIFKNNVSIVSFTHSSLAGVNLTFYGYTYNASMEFINGAKGFTHTPTTGFLPLSSANLPVPDALYRKPQNFADILLYTGDGVAIGSGGNAVTGAAFTPDLTWIKNRDAADSHQWTDIVRGVTKNLSSDSTAVEGTDTEGLTSFTSGGFTVGSDVSYNTNTEDYWAMCLKADNTSGASNTDGTETTTVSAGDFFSIVTYTGTAAVDTFGHGLGKTPDLILIKHRSGTFGWMVYHSSNTSAPETDYLQLNTTAATADLAGFLNDTAPTSSVFTLGTNTTANTSGGTYVAYCFVFDTTAGAEGSPFCGGVYTGNGADDGTMIVSDSLLMHCIKRTDAASNWWLFDQLRAPTYNPTSTRINPDSSGAESTLTGLEQDYLSNGFKQRKGTSNTNVSAATYIWWGIKKNGGQLWA